MEEFDKYRHLLFFLVWFFLLASFALVVLRGESNTPTFKVALLVFFLPLAGIIATTMRIRRKIREEMTDSPLREDA